MTNTNKLVASSKQNEEKKYSVIELAEKWGMTREGAQKKLNELKVPFEEVKSKNGGKPKKLYSIQEIQAMELKQQQVALSKINNQASALVSKKDEKVIGTAYYNNFNKLELKDQALNISVLVNSFLQNIDDTDKAQKEKITELEKIISEKDEEITSLRNIINSIEDNGKVKELQKQFTSYVANKCKAKNLIYGDVYNDIYNSLSKRYNIDFSKREKKQSIIEYIASLSNKKEYLKELLTIAATYFFDK